MLSFINNIDKIIDELFESDKIVIIFYNEYCVNSQSLLEIINNNDLELQTRIICINKSKYISMNSGKLNNTYFKSVITNAYLPVYQTQQISYNVLIDNNCKNLVAPHVYFFEKINHVPTLTHSIKYTNNKDVVDSFVEFINIFSKNENKIQMKPLNRQQIVEDLINYGAIKNYSKKNVYIDENDPIIIYGPVNNTLVVE